VPFLHHPNFFDPIIVSPLGAIENLWENAQENAYNLVVCPRK